MRIFWNLSKVCCVWALTGLAMMPSLPTAVQAEVPVVSKEDIETWGKQISMDGSMQGMMTMMQMAMSTMGLPDPSGAASGGGGAGPSAPNISSMLSMLSGAGGVNPAALLGAMGDNSNPLAALMQNLDIGELMKMLPKK